MPVHFLRPMEEAKQPRSLLPHKAPEFTEANVLGLDSRKRLDAPTQKRTAPWPHAVAAGRRPQKSNRCHHLLHLDRKILREFLEGTRNLHRSRQHRSRFRQLLLLGIAER